MTSSRPVLGTGSSHSVFYVRPDLGTGTETAIRKFFADRRVLAGTAPSSDSSDILVGLILDDEQRVLIAGDSGDVTPGQTYTTLVLEMAQKLRCFVTIEADFGRGDKGKQPDFVAEDPYAAWREIPAWRQSADTQETIQQIANRRQTVVEFATDAGWVIAATGAETDFEQLCEYSKAGELIFAPEQFPVVSLFRTPTHRIIFWQASPETEELVLRHLPELNPVVPEIPALTESAPVAVLTKQIRHLGYNQGVDPYELFPAPLATQLLATVNVSGGEFFATVLALLDGPVFAAHAIETKLGATAASAPTDEVTPRWIPLPGAVRVQPEPRMAWYKKLTSRWK